MPPNYEKNLTEASDQRKQMRPSDTEVEDVANALISCQTLRDH